MFLGHLGTDLTFEQKYRIHQLCDKGGTFRARLRALCKQAKEILTENETVTVSLPGEFIAVPNRTYSSVGIVGTKRESASPKPDFKSTAESTDKPVDVKKPSPSILKGRTKSSIGDLDDSSSSSSDESDDDDDDDIVQLLETKGRKTREDESDSNEMKRSVGTKTKSSPRKQNRADEEPIVNDESSSDGASDDDILNQQPTCREGNNKPSSPLAVRSGRADTGGGGDSNECDDDIWRDAPGEGDDCLPEAVLIAPHSPASSSGHLSRVVSEDVIDGAPAMSRGVSAPIPSPRDVQVYVVYTTL